MVRVGGDTEMEPLTANQRRENLEKVLARAEQIMKEDTARMPVGQAIIVANRFADTCNKLRRKSEESLANER